MANTARCYETTASFDVDAQRTFTPLCPDELPVQHGETIVPELNHQASFAKFRLGSKDAHHTKAQWLADEEHPVFSTVKGDNVDIRWPAHAIVGTQGFELLPGLPHPTDYDFFVWKGVELDMHPYGACYHDLHGRLSTGVIEFCKMREVTTVLVGGLALDYCVKTTALQLVKAGFAVMINLAATRAVDEATGAAAIEECRAKGIVFFDGCEAL